MWKEVPSYGGRLGWRSGNRCAYKKEFEATIEEAAQFVEQSQAKDCIIERSTSSTTKKDSFERIWVSMTICSFTL